MGGIPIDMIRTPEMDFTALVVRSLAYGETRSTGALRRHGYSFCQELQRPLLLDVITRLCERWLLYVCRIRLRLRSSPYL